MPPMDLADDKVLIVSGKDISTLSLEIPLSSILSNQADVFRMLSLPSAAIAPQDAAQCPPRIGINAPHHTVLFMPASSEGTTSVKCVSVPKPSEPLPAGVPGGIPGTTLLFHTKSSRVRAVVNAAELTAIRTAAGSVVANVLAIPPASERGRSVRNVVVFGGGMQAFYHAWLLCRVYDGIAKVTFALTRGKEPSASTRDSIRRLQSVLQGGQVAVEWSDQVEAKVREADIVCCCTPSDKPLLQTEWVKDGTHFNIVGAYKPHMVELPASLVQLATAGGSLVVDSAEACAKEAGDLIQADVAEEQLVELGTLVPDTVEDWKRVRSCPAWKRDESARGISIFKSVGVGVQDVAVTAMFVDEAERRGVGQRVDFF
ncbi:uncharacterized protein PFL1_02768 [Pseudozyma flocculosa PF-1]|uniref:Ornithine cyclodeaminase n=2 Tax=Pseudozyma flocculosa TaxID=84751 RepID=A0A5C3F0R1_9BASI|nr:uncharacterized protein PFL1_02768 [Pseudozyma flocculosa PF-1]EPQ29549.1 hypothetical protein PFL1_02768 [Pseudozyma flocculosa PF-1]SPO38093.1 uncharacterized protein PSFLO_03570 [Pseudozyma flocculosa]